MGLIRTAYWCTLLLQNPFMKHVTIIVPEGNANLSSITGTFEILTRANQYWQKMGNSPAIEICIAGYMNELKLDGGFFSVNPVNINDIAYTDLVIIPSLSHDYDNILTDNKELITWIRQQYKSGAEIASICTGAFLVAATGLLDGKS